MECSFFFLSQQIYPLHLEISSAKMGPSRNLISIIFIVSVLLMLASACSNGQRKLLEQCSSDGDCEAGLYCFSCPERFSGSRCVRSTITDQFKLLEPAIDTLKEIEAFMSAKPAEIVTLILEDYVQAPNGLTKVFAEAGLMKYWFPVSKMPKNGEDWPLVSDMVANNQRLLVFTSNKSKQESEGIAYQWSYMVENKYGNRGMHAGSCSNRAESSPLNDERKSLVLVNYFKSLPIKRTACVHNSGHLINMLHTCYAAAGNRWANFVAVDYYKRSEGRGSFQAVDTLNGRLLCGCDDVHACAVSSLNPLVK
ncbi:PLC-like phosphodiesterases superfamily protein [Citrus sinensis]|uniref:PLC-like phosphodiesterases superfamily protein n=1 Tax=Citrus sinensis TaxID=2711 RepID=A0ACB8K3N2_CITSI|nr:PLC-like phosphodiesterases superfamily protein [Citrus sinensis]